MAENSLVFDLVEALYLQERLNKQSDYWTISRLSPKPVSFTNTTFECHRLGGRVNWSEILKNLLDVTDELLKDALKRLNETVKKENIAALKKIQGMTLFEDQVAVGIGVHVVKKLTGHAETTLKRSKMKCPCGCQGKLDYTPEMFIGSEDTWHGELDMKSNGTGIAATTKIGNEGDKAVKETVRVISTSIVFGWTQVNRHPENSPFIPTVFIDNKKFTFSIYNPESDGLLLSDYSVLFIDDRFEALADKFSGIFLLWLILHHRLFFKREISYEIPPCGFKSEMKEQLEFYKNLHEYQKNVKVKRECPRWGTCLAVIHYPKKGVKRLCPNWY